MGLGGEVHDGRRAVGGQGRGDGGAVGDVGLDEGEARVGGHVPQALEAARIGQAVEDDHARGGARQGEADEVRSDESGPPGD